jgi:hypothetical protein
LFPFYVHPCSFFLPSSPVSPILPNIPPLPSATRHHESTNILHGRSIGLKMVTAKYSYHQ